MSFSFIEYTAGTKITEPGAYLNVPMSVYHGQPTVEPSISSSGLRTIFLESPAHYWDSSPLNPDRQDKPDSLPMILGRAAHHLLLGEKDFDRYFALRPDKLNGEKWNGNRLDCKAWLAERELEGVTVVTTTQIEQIRGMRKSLAAEPMIQGGVLNGYIEVSLFWRDLETGIWLKSRPDSIPTDAPDAFDLKVVADITDTGLTRGLGERGYHQQGAFVREGFREVGGLDLENFGLVYVEADRPHCVRIAPVAPQDLDDGALENRAALRLFKHCLDTGHWPGPQNRAGEAGYVRRSKWATDTAGARLKIIEEELAL